MLRRAAFLVLAAIGWPACAGASANFTLQFTGTLAPGAVDRVFPYDTGSDLVAPMAGDPLTISTHIVGSRGSLYVDAFRVAWSDPSLSSPFLAAWTDSGGVPISDNGSTTADFVSGAVVGSRGGTLSAYSSDYYVGATDGGVGLQLSYALGRGVTGQGRFYASINEGYDPQLGLYDEFSSAPFIIGSVDPGGSVPEPRTWFMLLAGLGGLGCVSRSRRRRLWREPI
jgi:hypothetical protein